MTKGGFSYRLGRTAGVGFVSAAAMVEAGAAAVSSDGELEKLLLVRCSEETKYHFAWVRSSV